MCRFSGVDTLLHFDPGAPLALPILEFTRVQHCAIHPRRERLTSLEVQSKFLFLLASLTEIIAINKT